MVWIAEDDSRRNFNAGIVAEAGHAKLHQHLQQQNQKLCQENQSFRQRNQELEQENSQNRLDSATTITELRSINDALQADKSLLVQQGHQARSTYERDHATSRSDIEALERGNRSLREAVEAFRERYTKDTRRRQRRLIQQKQLFEQENNGKLICSLRKEEYQVCSITIFGLSSNGEADSSFQATIVDQRNTILDNIWNPSAITQSKAEINDLKTEIQGLKDENESLKSKNAQLLAQSDARQQQRTLDASSQTFSNLFVV